MIQHEFGHASKAVLYMFTLIVNVSWNISKSAGPINDAILSCFLANYIRCISQAFVHVEVWDWPMVALRLTLLSMCTSLIQWCCDLWHLISIAVEGDDFSYYLVSIISLVFHRKQQLRNMKRRLAAKMIKCIVFS